MGVVVEDMMVEYLLFVMECYVLFIFVLLVEVLYVFG